jgi:nucleoside-diphosphate-sugar epimerase
LNVERGVWDTPSDMAVCKRPDIVTAHPMKVLVTGGAGYLGALATARLLREGHSVRVLDNLRYGGSSLLAIASEGAFEFCKGDVRDASTVQGSLAGTDAVVHLAAIVGDPACARDPSHAREVNLDAALQLVSLARQAGVEQFVFASTCSNYGRRSEAAGFAKEDDELKPVSLYAETKVAVETELLRTRSDGFAPTVLRFATLYGVSPRMRFDLTVNQFTMEMLTRGRISVYGERFWRPYVHAYDAARAIAAVLAAPAARVANQVFNVGDTGENYTKRDLVELIGVEVPDCKVEYVQKDEDPRDYRVSFDRIRSELAFEVSRRVPDGIREVAAAIRGGLIEDVDSPVYYNTPNE